MRDRLLVTGVITIVCCVRISIRPDNIYFSLQIKIWYSKGVNILCSPLNGEFICPPPITISDFVEDKFVQQYLTIERNFPSGVPLEIQSQQNIITAAVLLFNGPIENNRIQVVQSEVVGSS